MSIKSIAIDLIAPNPYRNFSIYPIEKAQVNALADSLAEAGDFGVIPVRKAWYEHDGGETYEQACGHHRLEAMRQLGFKTATILEQNYDDDAMVMVMALENTKQKGDNAPAMLDSLAGILQRVAYMMLVSETAADLGEISPVFDGMTEKAFKQARAQIISGHGISRNIIEIYAPGVFVAGQLKVLLTTLRDSGQLAKTIQRVQDEVQGELEAEAEIERERVAAEQKAAATRARQEAIAKRAADKAKAEASHAREAATKARKAADKARVRVAEARQKEAEAKAAVEADRQAKLAKLREKAAKEEAAKRETAKQAEAKRQRQIKEAQRSRAAFEKKARGLNPEVLHMLTREDHLETFRKFVVANPTDFPTEDHPMLVELIKQTANDTNRGKVTRIIIQGVMMNELNKRNAVRRMITEQRKTLAEKASVVRRVDNAIDEFRKALSKVNDAGRKLDKAMDDQNLEDYAYRELIADVQLGREILAGYNLFDTLRRKLRIRTMVTTVDDVIN